VSDATGTSTTTSTPIGGPDTPPRPSSGCDTPDAAFATTTDGVIQTDGEDRRYKLFAPAAGATEPVPIVMAIHGYGSGKDLFATISQLGALAQQEGFVALFPHGHGDPPQWDVSEEGAANATSADLAYLNDLLNTVESRMCIDTAREYLTGFSLGAAITTFLSCAQPERFAAAAPVAGISEFEPCEPSRPMPAMIFHGTDDPFARFDGGFGGPEERAQDPGALVIDGPPRADLVAAWAARNGCDSDTTETPAAEGARLVSYRCPAGADVGFYILDGAGHTWPGSEFHTALENTVGPTNMNIDASKAMWAFFKQHARA
jgi:polyhydroxybutyrate depolymerase